MFISSNFYKLIVRSDFQNKFVFGNKFEIPKIKTIEFLWISELDFSFEKYRAMFFILFLENLVGQKFKIFRIGRKLEGRNIIYRYKFKVTVKRNLFFILNQFISYLSDFSNVLYFGKPNVISKKNNFILVLRWSNFSLFNNIINGVRSKVGFIDMHIVFGECIFYDNNFQNKLLLLLLNGLKFKYI